MGNLGQMRKLRNDAATGRLTARWLGEALAALRAAERKAG